ncbi:MAG: ATP-dependent Clp protease proteolytic subunit [Candidatus Sumerlaeia bacterium]|nr:ATP-dependent Clp protease proteolytic subunit [Candidatus Sumerlaeia bacterium]
MAARTRGHVLLLEDVEKCEKEVIEALMGFPVGGEATIVINSGGGSVYAGLAIGTVVRHRRMHCHAQVLADCSSSALLVFAACQTREVSPHASFLFHPMQWSSDDRSRVNGARSWSEEFLRVSKVCEDWLSELLPISRSVLRRWVQQEKYVVAQELIDLGIATEMALPAPRVVGVEAKPKRRAAAARAKARPVKIRRAG